MVDNLESSIRAFAHGDDADYLACVEQHGGYVLTQRSRRSDGFMLHEAHCSHLGLTPGAWTLTTRPRRWARSREALVEWTNQQTGTPPVLCQSCM